MADKFEFKNPQNNNYLTKNSQFPTSNQNTNPSLAINTEHRKKASLLQYKQVIIQLSNALNDLAAENQIIKSDFIKEQNKSKQLEILLEEKLIELEQISTDRKNIEEKLSQMIGVNEQNLNVIHEYTIKINMLDKSNKHLSSQYNQEIQRSKYLQSTHEVNLQKIKLLQQQIELMAEENYNLKQEVANLSKNSMDQVRQLKQVNQDLKRKFQIIQIQSHRHQSFAYPEAISYNLDHKLSQFKQKRSFSTQKKPKRNIGCLSNSSTNMNKFPTRNHYKFQQQNISPDKNIKPFEISNPNNPELSHELQNLKKQIAHQYTLINLKTETYNKQRVSKTLEQLKRKMGKAIQVAQQTQSQC